MNSKNKGLFSKTVLFLSLLAMSTQTFAVNISDSDLSNHAESNQHWQTPFWFFICVGFLVAAAIVGSKKKYIQINRNYKGPKA